MKGSGITERTGWTEVASGLFASHPSEVGGPVRIVCGLQEIQAMMREPQTEPCIVVTNVAGGSAVSTIIRRAKAIVSTVGGPNSHIVVVARDYNLPCIVGAAELDIAALSNGVRMRLRRNGTIEIRDMRNQHLSLRELQLLRTISFAGALKETSEAIGFDDEDVEALIDSLAHSGLVQTSDLITVSPAGTEALEAWYAADRHQLDEDSRAALLKSFRPLDRETKRIASLWQNANDDGNRDGCLHAIEALGTLHAQAMTFLSHYATHIRRLDEYLTRLERAYQRVTAGQIDYFVGVRADSYHTAWVHMHEDLLRILQRERDPE